jgi:hypothetical protein
MKRTTFLQFRTWTGLAIGVVRLIAVLFIQESLAETDPKHYAVQASAIVQSEPAQITLQWTADGNATGYQIFRKGWSDTSWGAATSLPGGATQFTDRSVSRGTRYEYRISKETSRGYRGHGYVAAGIEAPAVEARGKVVLIVDSTHAAALAAELTRLQQDLAGDGWVVVRNDVSRSETPPQVKARIKAAYQADPANVKAVFLFGHIAVPYSGDFNPDGHPDHQGAWAADAYYGDMDGNWTDSSVHSTGGERVWSHNVPGDGKFDHSDLPSDVELQVGRVDLHNMTCFSNKTPSRSEVDLLRQYLNKDHQFRHGRVAVERRGVICDNFGERDGEAFAASGWRNFSAFFGAENVLAVPGWSYFPTLKAQSYLWSYGTGGGAYYTCDGIGSSDGFATNDVQSVFTFFLGSYFGDWDNESNFLRAPLGGTSYTLTSAWAGRPHWFVHHMALGETIGFGTRLSQNNSSVYSEQNHGSRMVHVALMGDPTLRMHPVAPPSGFQGSLTAAGMNLNWVRSADSGVVGYRVYRGTSAAGPFAGISGDLPANATTFTDPSGAAGWTYLVRALKLERSGSGTYFNLSQGIFWSAIGGGVVIVDPPVRTAPSAPLSLSARAAVGKRVDLHWRDTSSDETEFRIERRVGVEGSFSRIATVGSDVTSYSNTGLEAGAQYQYRVCARNAAGDSPYCDPVAVTALSEETDLPAVTKAQVSFVGVDAETGGDWRGTYGGDGFQIAGEAAQTPGFARVRMSGAGSYIWSDSTTDRRALSRSAGTGRIASCWFAADTFAIDLDFTDGQAHRIAVYCLDWDTSERAQVVQVLDAASGAVLSERTVSGFNGGQYLVWDVTGHVTLRLTRTTGNNAVVMGLFFGPASAPSNGGNPAPALRTSEAVSVAAGQFRLRLSGQPGQTLEVQASDNLTDWVPVRTVVLPSASVDFYDTTPPGVAGRYYRAVPAP